MDQFNEAIEKWIAYIKKHELNQFYFIIKTIRNWHNEISNMITTGLSNGKAERINRDIKQAKNLAFGYRNLARSSKLMIMRSQTNYA
jgi:transposase